jgi:phosphohistidine swiveling domain-containing protein
MRILLTEVTGGLGRALAQSLLASGHDVSGVALRAHRDLDPGVDFVSAAPGHRAIYDLAADADVVLPLPSDGDGGRLTELVRICDAAARGGARLVFPSLSLLTPARWQQAEDLVGSGWAPSLIVRIAAPVGRQADGLVCRSIAALLNSPTSGPVHVVHIDDLIRFLVAAVGSDRTGTVDLATSDTTNVVSARRILGTVDPRPKVRSIAGWPVLTPTLDLASLHDDWQFECGWGATDAVADTARGLQGRKPDVPGAATVTGRIPLPRNGVPRSAGAGLVSAAPEGAEGEFDDRIDPRFPVFVTTPFTGAHAVPLTPMSLDLHATGLRTGARALAELLDLPPVLAREWESRLVAVFGHRIYLGASALAAAEPRLPGRAAELGRRLRIALAPDADTPLGRPRTAQRWLRPAVDAVTMARMVGAARMFGRHVDAYADAASSEYLGAAALEALTDAQLDARVRLLRSRIHEGWTLAALGVLLAEVAPNHLTTSVDQVIRIQSELNSLARVLRAHPYVQSSLDAGDLEASRSAAPMVGAAFDTVLSRIGHRGPGSFEVAASVIGDRPAAVLAAAQRTAAHNTAADHRAPAHRAVAYDSTLRFTHQLRAAVREIARRRVTEEKLATAEDIYFLTVDEALAMPVDTRLRVKRRAAERERLQAVTVPSVFDGTWTPAPNPVAAQADEQLHGHTVVAGVAEGTIRVVRSADDADLQPGDLAVIAAADLESVPLLGTPGAVITDDGPSLADPAVTAAELGVPVLAGIRDAGTLLITGMRARVDAAAGTLTVLASRGDAVPQLAAQAQS